MRFSSLFARAAPLVHREEPVTGADPTARADVPRQSSSSSLKGKADAVLELLGVPPDEVRWKAEESGTNEGDRLLGTLYAQYCQAIDSPHALEPDPGMDRWGESAARSGDGPDARGAYGQEALSEGDIEGVTRRPAHGAAGTASISDVLGDINRLDEAFGPLTMEPDGLGATGAPHSVPEILRLFAPQEWHHEAMLHHTPLPAVLARREHHTLAIDSPLPALSTMRTAADETNQENE